MQSCPVCEIFLISWDLGIIKQGCCIRDWLAQDRSEQNRGGQPHAAVTECSETRGPKVTSRSQPQLAAGKEAEATCQHCAQIERGQ